MGRGCPRLSRERQPHRPVRWVGNAHGTVLSCHCFARQRASCGAALRPACCPRTLPSVCLSTGGGVWAPPLRRDKTWSKSGTGERGRGASPRSLPVQLAGRTLAFKMRELFLRDKGIRSLVENVNDTKETGTECRGRLVLLEDDPCWPMGQPDPCRYRLPYQHSGPWMVGAPSRMGT